MHDPIREVDRQVWRDGRLSEGARRIPEETALALTYNGGTYAVMMGTPRDLRDFAIGFSLSEGVVQSANEIASLDILEVEFDTLPQQGDQSSAHLPPGRARSGQQKQDRERIDLAVR